MSKNDFFRLLMSFLALHLLYTNTNLLLKLEELDSTWIHVLTRGGFALTYSVMTVFIIDLYPRLYLIILFGFLDGFGVYLKYQIYQENFIILASVYFGLYTFLIVVASVLIKKHRAEKSQEQIQNSGNNGSIQKEKSTEELRQEYKDLEKQRKSLQGKINRSQNKEERKEAWTKIKEIKDRKNELKKII